MIFKNTKNLYNIRRRFHKIKVFEVFKKNKYISKNGFGRYVIKKPFKRHRNLLKKKKIFFLNNSKKNNIRYDKTNLKLIKNISFIYFPKLILKNKKLPGIFFKNTYFKKFRFLLKKTILCLTDPYLKIIF